MASTLTWSSVSTKTWTSENTSTWDNPNGVGTDVSISSVTANATLNENIPVVNVVRNIIINPLIAGINVLAKAPKVLLNSTEIIGRIELKGQRDLYIQLQGRRDLTIPLKGSL